MSTVETSSEPFPDKIGEVFLAKNLQYFFYNDNGTLPQASGPLLYLGNRQVLVISTQTKVQCTHCWYYWEEFAKPFEKKKYR